MVVGDRSSSTVTLTGELVGSVSGAGGESTSISSDVGRSLGSADSPSRSIEVITGLPVEVDADLEARLEVLTLLTKSGASLGG